MNTLRATILSLLLFSDQTFAQDAYRLIDTYTGSMLAERLSETSGFGTEQEFSVKGQAECRKLFARFQFEFVQGISDSLPYLLELTCQEVYGGKSLGVKYVIEPRSRDDVGTLQSFIEVRQGKAFMDGTMNFQKIASVTTFGFVIAKNRSEELHITRYQSKGASLLDMLRSGVMDELEIYEAENLRPFWSMLELRGGPTEVKVFADALKLGDSILHVYAPNLIFESGGELRLWKTYINSWNCRRKPCENP